MQRWDIELVEVVPGVEFAAEMRRSESGGWVKYEDARSLADEARHGIGRERELLAERDWLRHRAKIAGSYVASATRSWGVSSNALVDYAVGGPEPEPASIRATRPTLPRAAEHFTAPRSTFASG